MIRDATLLDVPRLLHLGALMHAESPRLYRWPFAREKVERLLVGLVTNPSGCLLVAERNGDVVGGFAGWVDEHWACHARQASDFALFVHPGRRGSLDAVRLVRAFKAWAREHGADMVQVGISAGIAVEAGTRLYEHEGFEVVGPIMELREL